MVVVDPADYPVVLGSIRDGTSADLRRDLMAKAFRHTAFYDSMIARYLSVEEFPELLTMGYRRVQALRYGENPHQSGAVYVDPLQNGGVANGKLRWGKELSYNNLLDADAAWELVSDLEGRACAIIKHGNPCGAAISESYGQSYRSARSSDPISAFGGIAAFNGPVEEEAAIAMTEKGNFLEVILASEFSPEAIRIFEEKAGWGQSVRLVECCLAGDSTFRTIRTIRGGVLVQPTDEDPSLDWRVVTHREPTPEEWASLRLAWKIVKHVKSNAIVICRDHQLRGTGAGQMNRVQSVRLALEQAGDFAQGAALASDAFFPFSDSIQTAAASGVTAFIQPGGSKKDDDSIQAANDLGLTMVMTGVRHFRH
jgi:phosphoribosylaminoimidazolecarboxamide formyltransferase/IMP cyclohydrolase